MEKRYWELVFLGSDEKMNLTPVGQDYQARIPDFEVLSKLTLELVAHIHSLIWLFSFDSE